MKTQRERIGYLYVNGLNDGTTKPQDRLVQWWWRAVGLELRHAHINWFNEQSLDEKIQKLEDLVKEMLEQFGGVAIVGTSAGASLAINAFHKIKNDRVCAISAHGRLRVGDYSQNDRASLYRRAYLHTGHPSHAFADSVTRVENETALEMSDQEKQRLLTLSSVVDMVVPPNLMKLDGVRDHRAIAFGHAGGFLSHMIGDRDIIGRFANGHITN